MACSNDVSSNKDGGDSDSDSDSDSDGDSDADSDTDADTGDGDTESPDTGEPDTGPAPANVVKKFLVLWTTPLRAAPQKDAEKRREVYRLMVDEDD